MTTNILKKNIMMSVVIGTLLTAMLFVGGATTTHAHEDEPGDKHMEEDRGFFDKPFFKREIMHSEDDDEEDNGEDDGDDSNGSSFNRESLRAEIEVRRTEARARLEAQRANLEEKRAEIQEKREERKIKLAEKSKERIRAYIERIEHRFEAAIERLEKIGERILSRIEKFEGQGKNMDEPRLLLTEAQDELDAARIAIELFVDEALLAVEAEEPKIAFDSVRELSSVAKDSLKNAHRALVEAIVAIKAEGGIEDESEDEDDDTTTTTATTTDNE